MTQIRVLRMLLGGAGLCGCIALLAGQARAQVADIYGKWNSITVTHTRATVAPELFNTVALPVKAERYLDGWERARRDASGHPALQQLIAPARALPRDQQLAYVQSAVHQRIRWISDATEWGAHDYWASAAETLRHGAGDMEDRAILKMQALRALGVPNRDLFLTMGRDKVGGPITVLIVRTGTSWMVLDDTGGAPFATVRRPDFEPVLTFGYGGQWIHGRRVMRGLTATTAGATSTTAAKR